MLSSTRRRSSPSGSAWSSTRTSTRRSWPATSDGAPSTTRSAADCGRGCHRPRPRRRRARRAAARPAAPALRGEGRRHRLGHARVEHHVGLHREAVADDVAGVRDARASPVCTAARPVASTIATWRVCGLRRRRRGRRRAPPRGSRPARSRASAVGPVGHLRRGLGGDGPDARPRATARPRPTEKKCDCTATPSCPGVRAASDDRVRHPPRRAAQRREGVLAGVVVLGEVPAAAARRASGGPRRDRRR